MDNSFKIHFIKTYWSDCILLEYKNKFALIDTGSINDEEYIITYLRNQNVIKLEFIIITHFHCDHYGCFYKILESIDTNFVYIKEYSGLDYTRADGKIADDEYRKQELIKYNNLIKYCKEKNVYCSLDGLNSINFDTFKIDLYNNNNNLKDIYDNRDSKYYHKYKYSENFNSLGLVLDIFYKKIYLGGDLIDMSDDMDVLDYLNYQVCKRFKGKVDIYKAAHHGMDNGTGNQTLKLINPEYVVVTNHEEDLKDNTNIFNFAKNQKKKLFFTYDTIIFEIKEDGKIEVIR